MIKSIGYTWKNIGQSSMAFSKGKKDHFSPISLNSDKHVACTFLHKIYWSCNNWLLSTSCPLEKELLFNKKLWVCLANNITASLPCWIEATWLLFGTCLLFGSCHFYNYEPCLLFGSIVFHNEACVLFGLCWVWSEPCVDKIFNSRQGSVYKNLSHGYYLDCGKSNSEPKLS